MIEMMAQHLNDHVNPVFYILLHYLGVFALVIAWENRAQTLRCLPNPVRVIPAVMVLI